MAFRKTISAVIAAVLLLSSSGMAFANEPVGEGAAVIPRLTVNGQSFVPLPSVWGLGYSRGLPVVQFKPEALHTPYELGSLKGMPVMDSPDFGSFSVTVSTEDGQPVFEGTEKEFTDFCVKQNGSYVFSIEASAVGAEKSVYNKTHFCFRAHVTLVPKVSMSAGTVGQGDVLRIGVDNVPSGVRPRVSTDLGMAAFTEKDGKYEAFVPVGYLKPVGSYRVTVTVGDVVSENTVQVAAGNFKKQYMTINKSNPVISEASSPKAYKQYRDTIYPLFDTADKTRYWTGPFTQPVKGRISTEFGLLRYTNGNKTPSGHGGVDLAAPTGTTVLAASAGRVVYSNYLLNTGNTIVIEHGGGLKSYYFHLNKRNVYTGDMVAQAQKIGEVGTTGYSTGAHLHFEIKIGNQPINPWNLINGSGGFFSEGE